MIEDEGVKQLMYYRFPRGQRPTGCDNTVRKRKDHTGRDKQKKTVL